jgi:glycosyltransferase involved in cell wall biosynthesis
MCEESCGVSLVVTVRDEAGAIDELCASIAAQTLAPDEVVVVDGGSADDTVARLGRWRERLPLRVLTVPGASISQGRNAGVAAARHELIAVMWIGRDDYVADEWDEAVTRARAASDSGDVDYISEKGPLHDYLTKGLFQLKLA